MTSKIKVDNINKVSDDSNIINKCGTSITMGQNGDTVIIPNGVTEQIQSGGDIQVQSGGQITIASGATITNNGTAVGLGRTGTVDWLTTPKVTGDSPVTGVSGTGYFMNTTAGEITLNLPAGSAGDIVSMADYAGTWDTYNLTVVPNGSEKIGGIAASASLSTEGQSITLVYVDAVQGWVNTMDSTSNVRGNASLTATVSGACNTLATAPCCANTKIATFVNPGTFCVTQQATSAPYNEVSYLLVAGGGGSGSSCGGGGGGAGGFRETKSPNTPYTQSPKCGYAQPSNRITLSTGPYPIVVGGGGAAATPSPRTGGNGDNTTAFGLTAAGGGGGSGPSDNAGDGGSGGGGRGNCGSSGGSGNTPATTPSQGTDGGRGRTGSGSYQESGAGGGGANSSGSDGIPNGAGGNGGAGVSTTISSASTAYAGGGGGGTGGNGGPALGSGGTGGGGAGGNCQNGPTDGVDGTDNTGGGGGGAGGSAPGRTASGGSGIVIIRYKFQ